MKQSPSVPQKINSLELHAMTRAGGNLENAESKTSLKELARNGIATLLVLTAAGTVVNDFMDKSDTHHYKQVHKTTDNEAAAAVKLFNEMAHKCLAQGIGLDSCLQTAAITTDLAKSPPQMADLPQQHVMVAAAK